jgi:hypothetical protein
MKTGATALAAIILILAAAYWAHQQGWLDPVGRYQLYPAASSTVGTWSSEARIWRLDTKTGAVSVCKTMSKDIGPDLTWCGKQELPLPTTP